MAELATDEVIRVIQDYVCARDHWEQHPPRRGRTMPLTIGRQGAWTLAWLDTSAPALDRDRKSDSFLQWSYFLAIGRKFGQAVILQDNGYPPGHRREFAIYEDGQRLPFTGSVEQVDFVEPMQCPSTHEETPTKARIRQALVAATRKQLSAYNKHRPSDKYPEKLKIVVENFTVADRFVSVYVPATGEVFRLALHDFQNPHEDDAYVRNEEFPFGQAKDPSRREISLIQRDGTTHEIRLND